MGCVAAVNRNGVLDLGKYKIPPPHIPAPTLAPLSLSHLCPVSRLLRRQVLSQKFVSQKIEHDYLPCKVSLLVHFGFSP